MMEMTALCSPTEIMFSEMDYFPQICVKTNLTSLCN